MTMHVAATRPQRPLQLVFGFRSPYAWLAHHLLERSLTPEELARIEWIPCWQPAPATHEALIAGGGGVLYRDMSKERHLYILRDIKRLAAQFGEPLAWPIDPPQPDWEAAHLLYIAAVDAGRGAAARAAIFAARWTRGENLSDPAVVVALARSLDLDPAPEIPLERRVAPLRWVFDRRVFGLPYAIVGRDHFWGLDRLPFALRAAGLPADAAERLWFPPALSAAA